MKDVFMVSDLLLGKDCLCSFDSVNLGLDSLIVSLGHDIFVAPFVAPYVSPND